MKPFVIFCGTLAVWTSVCIVNGLGPLAYGLGVFLILCLVPHEDES